MKTPINVCIPGSIASSYPIWIGSKLLENISSWMPNGMSTVVIITDNWVKKHYAFLLKKSLNKEGYKTLKKRAGRVRYVLLNALGTVYEINNQFAHSVSDEIVKKAFLETIED